ncbi:MAG: acyl-CoA dehydratase activase [Dehalococcoidales bacterium]|nr:acyl-CoA dehydratase activase [Dehalococcoidales bacterium]
MYFAGLDLGSTMTKVVVIDESEKVVGRVVNHTGAEHRRLANKVMEQALAEAGLAFDEITYVIATGYGRINVPFADRQVTELTCHARGVASFFPSVRIALDIGGQDAKGLKINSQGKLIDFVMNDRCAAGTGRFLEVIAKTLCLELEDLGPISLKSTNKIIISNTCTIFAQQEVTSRLSDGVPVEDVVAGIHDAIARRAVGMLRRLKVEPDVVFTGGVAKNTGVVKAVKEALGMEVFVPEDPLISGALGAAILGKEFVQKAQVKGETIEKKERRLTEATFFK